MAIPYLNASFGRVALEQDTNVFPEQTGHDSTECIAKALSESTYYLQSILNAMALPVFVKDTEHRFVLVNDALCELFDRTREQIIGTTGYEYLPAEQVDVFIEMDNEVFNSGKRNTNEELITDKLGNVRTFITEKTLFTDAVGNRFIVGVISDITERKRAEEEKQHTLNRLKKKMELFRIVGQVGHIGIFELDLEKRVVKSSAEGNRIYGFDPDTEETSLEDILQCVVDKKGVEKALQALIDHKTPYNNIHTVIPKNSTEVRTVHGMAELLTNEHGRTVVAGVVSDITELTNAKEDLRKSEVRSTNILKNANIGLWVTDADGNILQVNRAYCRMSGYTEKELLNMRISQLDRDATEVLTAQRLNQIKKKGEDFFEARHVRKDGSILPVEVSAQPDPNNGGQVIIFLQDITDRKKAQKESKARLKELQAHYQLSEIATRKGMTIEQVFTETVKMLPQSWRYPEITAARITTGDLVFSTANYTDSPWKLKADMKVSGRRYGEIEVVYLEERPTRDEGPFAIQERQLLKSIAERLGAIAERKLTFLALKQNEERFRAVAQSASDAIVTSDSSGLVTDWNAGAERMFGHTAHDMIGRPVTTIIPKRMRAQHQAGMERVSAGGEHHVIGRPTELQGLHSSGKEFPIELSIAKWEIGSGLHFTAIIRDITARKEAEQKLLQLSQGIEQSSATVVITDLNGNIEYVNRKFTETTGYAPDEVIGQNPRVLKSGHTTQEEYKQLWDNITTGEDWWGEFQNKRKNGELYWESAHISPIKDASGKTVNFIAIKEDITQRKAAIDALITSENFLREAQLTANLGTYTLDIVHDRWTSSDILDGIFGIDADFERNTFGWASLIHPDCSERMGQYFLEHVLDRKNRFDAEYRIVRQNDGETRWVHGQGTLKFDSKGKPVAMIGTIHDITQRKETEEEIRQLNTFLEEKIVQRTSELADANDRLMAHAQDMLASINYASRIQKAFTHRPIDLANTFNGAFCLLMKRDRVSGDFFWHLDVGDMHFLAAVDCTGHGIPGALLSMIANEFLNNIVKEQHCYEPEDILMRLDMKLVESLHQNDNDLVRDGMDVSLCRIDGDRQRIVFSGACRPLFHFDGKEIIEIEGSKNSIGGLVRPDVEKLFGQQEIAYRPGDCIYLTSDGYASQFNHLTGKKLMKRGLVNELLAVATLEAEQQRLELKRYFLEWKGDDEQVDDVVIIGVKF